MSASDNVGPERTRLNFPNAVRESFAFLSDLGFSVVELLPTLIRFKKADLELNIYHGRQSFEIGFELAREGTRYSISEIIRATDPSAADRYRNFATTTPQGLGEGLAQLRVLVQQYGAMALQNDPAFFRALESQRKAWSEAYALDVLAQQLRPKADEAFRQGDYRKAVELYEQIRPCLTPSELKKLMLATSRQ
jgi:hypothetical protein